MVSSLLGLALGCTERQAPTAAPSQKVETRAAHQQVELSPDQGPLPEQLRQAVTQARRAGLKPVAYLHASWCPPCKAIEESMGDARMAEAFAGTYVIGLDVDAWGGQLTQERFDGSTIPAYFALNGEGRPTGHPLTGAAWDDNLPENMAPPLKAFFSTKLR
jgi:thiol-disulfide isomerase/thioredoxin